MKPPFNRLSSYYQNGIKYYLEANGITTDPKNLTAEECVQYWCEWNGIINYHNDIIRLVLDAFGTK